MPDIEVIKQLVVQAGKTALKRCGTVGCEYKADESIVTEVDRDTERFLRGELAALTPGYSFLGEEYGLQGSEIAPLWACDPIDGTTNFVTGIPLWGVSLGLIENGEATLGVIYLPPTDELFWGTKGGGAFCNGQPIRCPDRDSLHLEDTLCLTSNTIKTVNAEAVACRIRCLGTIAAELAYTARGSLSGVVGLHEGIVDMAAGFCFCAEAGCVFRHLTGGDLTVADLLRTRRTEQHFIVAPPRLADHLQQTLRPVRAL